MGPAEHLYSQRALALARALMAVFALLAVYLDPTEPVRYVSLTYTLLAAYTFFSLAVVVPSSFEIILPPWFSIALHVIDVAFAGAITLFTEGPNSPFFAFFVLNLLAAAYTWGLRGTSVSAITGVVILWAQMLLLDSAAAVAGGLIEGSYDLNRAVMRTTYLMIIGILAGVLGEYQHQFLREQRLLAQLLVRPHIARSNRTNMQVILGRVLQAFAAAKVTCVVEAAATGQLVKWVATPVRSGSGIRVRLARIAGPDRHLFLFGPPGCSWYIDRDRWWPSRSGIIDQHGKKLPQAALAAVRSTAMARSADSMLSVFVPVSEDWACRVFVANPQVGLNTQQLLEFAYRAAREVVPATYNTYLLLRMKSRAESDERARLARDLHDGLTQSLIGTEIQVGVLAQQAEQPDLRRGLMRVREILRAEIMNLRDLVRQTRAASVKPSNLQDYIVELVDGFQRDTGISTRFLCDLKGDDLPLSSRSCRELAQIVREALANIRKHSGARQALISLTAGDGRLTLIIDDNGRGFPFVGRYEQAELDRLRKGPLVIKERVRSIRGELTVESTPEQGSRLHINVPA